MNVERLSNAWLYPATRQPVFSNSSMEGLSSASDEMVAERASVTLLIMPTARMEANDGTFISISRLIG